MRSDLDYRIYFSKKKGLIFLSFPFFLFLFFNSCSLFHFFRFFVFSFFKIKSEKINKLLCYCVIGKEYDTYENCFKNRI